MRVIVTDGGTPSLSANQSLSVRVLHVESNAPQFSQGVYEATVGEAREAGQPVVTVTAVLPAGV